MTAAPVTQKVEVLKEQVVLYRGLSKEWRNFRRHSESPLFIMISIPRDTLLLNTTET